jgi:ligand-binding SRPBCC domain-containing protein
LVRGAFASFTHTHVFRVDGNLTLMIDTFRYRCPLGVLGSVADILFLKRYMTAFLRNRADYLKQLAESDWPGDDTLPKCPRRRQG